MDDLDEGKSSDLGMYGRYTYISSWTDDSRENIPLWAMYTSDMQGVRIKMKKNIFDTEILKKGEDNNKEDIVYSKGLINIQKRNNITFNPPYTAQLYKVEYTDEESKLYPYLLKKTLKMRLKYLWKIGVNTKEVHGSFKKNGDTK